MLFLAVIKQTKDTLVETNCPDFDLERLLGSTKVSDGHIRERQSHGFIRFVRNYRFAPRVSPEL